MFFPSCKVAQRGNSRSYTRKIVPALSLYNTTTLKKKKKQKKSDIANILLDFFLFFIFFLMEDHSYSIQILHPSPKTDSAFLVQSGLESFLFPTLPVLILQRNLQSHALW